MRIRTILIAASLGFPSVYAEASLQVGLDRVEITPPVGYVMGGYSAREGDSTGVHDPLYATVAVFRSPRESLAIVSLDLRSFPSERVAGRVREATGLQHVFLCSSHTHSGPLTWEDKSWPEPDSSWFAATEAKITAAIRKASASTFEAFLDGGRGSIQIGHNRRRILPDGTVEMFWRNETREPTSPVDPTLRVLRVSDRDGRTRAVFVNYACHAVILGPDNREISADWPGFLRDEIEEQLGPGTLALFLQGAAGDINPYLDKQPVDREGFAKSKEAGQAVAREVLRVLKGMKRNGDESGPVAVREESIEVEHRWEEGKKIPLGYATALLGSGVGMVCWPGEAFVEFQLSLTRQSPLQNTLFAGYCHTGTGVWGGYFPTREAALQGGYGAGYNTTVAVGTGEQMLDRMLETIRELHAGKGR